MDAKAGLIVSQNGYVQRATYYTIVFDSGAHTAGLPLVNLGNESIQGQRGTWADWASILEGDLGSVPGSQSPSALV